MSMKFVVIPPEGIGQVKDEQRLVSDQGKQAERLEKAALAVQDVAYSLATSLDDTTMTELMVASRKLERLAERVAVAEAGAAKKKAALVRDCEEEDD